MSLPTTFSIEDFKEKVTGNGVYYRLNPKSSAFGEHLFDGPIFLPVTDSIGWGFSHSWSEADNLVKNITSSLVGDRAAALIDNVSRYAQRAFGAGLHASACSVFADSAPPTINVKSKLISGDGSGKVIRFLEKLRKDTHSTLKGGEAGGYQGGIVDHPEWWEIQVVAFAGGDKTIIADMKNMVCTGLNVTMYTPFVSGEKGMEPSMTEIDIAFKHGFRGLRRSMSFGKYEG